jgi:2-polyprenyl-6-methoxyphenol hydroxylase-like FAD-dependent oxidoreductase
MEQRQVLIVGAGPTGLVLALWLSRFGVGLRIIDKAPRAGTTSRAMVVHARCLEFYRQLGIADVVIEAGEKARLLDGHLDRKHIARIPFGDFGEGLSRYPFILVLPQAVHERVLEAELKKAGVSVERNCELLEIEHTNDSILTRLRTATGEENTRFEYLCGCDGAHSSVREKCGISFPGGTYEQVFFVADAAIAGQMVDDNVHFAFTDREMLGVFPLKRRASWRLIGIVPRNVTKAIHEISYADVADQVRHTAALEATRVNWFSTYHVHHRVAGAFRKGRAFLLGDAGHIHSPAGGQGMNTGIGDASNLGWKLAAVLQGRAEAALLESYGAERIAIAYRIVRSTDRIFSFQVSPSWPMRMARRWLTPLIPALMRLGAVRRFIFRTISQIAFAYRESPISAGSAGRVRGGDRLPWFQLANGGDNHEALRDLDWQVHVYGEVPKSLETCCRKRGLPLRQFPWGRPARAVGLDENALYLVRPDGHVGLAARKEDFAALEQYLSRLEIRPRPKI